MVRRVCSVVEPAAAEAVDGQEHGQDGDHQRRLALEAALAGLLALLAGLLGLDLPEPFRQLAQLVGDVL